MQSHRLLESKTIAPLWHSIKNLSSLLPQGSASYHYEQGIHIAGEIFDTPLDSTQLRMWQNLLQSNDEQILHRLHASGYLDSPFVIDSKPLCIIDLLSILSFRLKSWRKGAFILRGEQTKLHIDSEWQSFKKWDILVPFAKLNGAYIADVGCNNGFYMFAMYNRALQQAQTTSQSKPYAEIVGFDPSGLFFCQFQFINHLLNMPITYELLGVQDMPTYTKAQKNRFDIVFCLGVLYHRSDVFSTLKALALSLEKGGIVFLDTLIFDSNDIVKTAESTESCALDKLDIVLSIRKSYAKMSNVYFLPSVCALEGWLERCGFIDIEVLAIVPTTTQEQRATLWIDSMSLEHFLDPLDSTKTAEGYPAPKRAYIKARRK